jgi:hypothetical protein
VEAAIRDRVVKIIDRDGGATCDYTGKTGRVTITIRQLPRGFDFAAEIDSLRAAMPFARIRLTTDLGARGAFVELCEAGTQLHVISRTGTYVLVSVLGYGPARDVSTAAETLARRVPGVI